MTSLDRDQLIALLLRDLDHELERFPTLRTFAERVADTILAALAEHDRRARALEPEFGEEDRDG
ncbi:MAG: hypothetical protein NZL87_05895 [Thermomicrobium sp.]|nr:hypothetical protein [Thermomicrobium sp.]MDW7981991.1 hypothetical protein [Thermomicrobium sp.]